MTVLNHTDSSVTSIYNRSHQFKQKLEALKFWNENLMNKDIVGAGPTKCIRVAIKNILSLLEFYNLYSHIIVYEEIPFISSYDNPYFVVYSRKKKTYRKCW